MTNFNIGLLSDAFNMVIEFPHSYLAMRLALKSTIYLFGKLGVNEDNCGLSYAV